jgi:hypothetical protein
VIRAAVVVAALLCAGCPRAHDLPRTAASVALVEAPGWRTLTAQHKVTVTVTLDGGKQQTRQLRGVIAVQRPDRLRLRALGPAGITLFDLLVRNGAPKVLAAIRRPGEGGGDALAEVIRSLASDLACAYTLDPRPEGRSVTLDGDRVLVREPGREVWLSRFAGSPPTWRHAEIRSGRYTVAVEVDDAETDATLDPALFEEDRGSN